VELDETERAPAGGAPPAEPPVLPLTPPPYAVHPAPPTALQVFEQWVGRYLHDADLLALSLAHRSYCAENPGTQSNERLEFLGDSVLGLVVTDHLYRLTPGLDEGALAKVRAAVVSTESLARVAAAIGVGAALRLGRGEAASGGRSKPSLLADAFEAIIGATYLEGGMVGATALVMETLGERIAEAAAEPGLDDHKTRLQELAVQFSADLPRYHVADSGPDHDKHFVAEVFIGNESLGIGEGRSKKQAEQSAASAAATTLRARLVARGSRPSRPSRES
jgi:ribonuclease-3